MFLWVEGEKLTTTIKILKPINMTKHQNYMYFYIFLNFLLEIFMKQNLSMNKYLKFKKMWCILYLPGCFFILKFCYRT